MALIKKWPANAESGLDNKQWIWNEWPTGTPITQGKLENLENGVAILATQISAIFAEMDTSTYSKLISNASRLDNIQSWITGSSSTNYDSANSIMSRLAAVEALNTQQNNKLTAIISEIGGTGNDGSSTTYGGTSRIDNLAVEVWGSNTTSGTSRIDKIQSWITGNSTIDYNNTNISDRIDTLAGEIWGNNGADQASRIDKNENKIAAIAAELGGTAPDGNSTTYGGTTRLDDLEKEIGGTRSSGNGYNSSRIDTLEFTTSTHTNELTAIKNELGGSISGSTYNGTTRLDSVITKASSLATEIWGSDTTSGDSRIDKLTTELYGSNVTDYTTTSKLDSAITKLSTITTELYGSDNTSVTSRLDDLEKEVCGDTITRTTNGKGYTNSRIDLLESTSTSYGTKLTDIENKNIAQDNKLAAIMNELGGTGNDGSNTTYGGASRLDTAITEIWGSNTTTGNSRIDNIETHDASVDKAIVAIKTEIGGTYVENNGFTNSRIDAIETLNTTQNTRLDSIEALDIRQNERLDNVESKNDTQDSRIDSLELKVGNGAIGTDANISAAIRRLSNTVTGLDPTGSAEAIGFLVEEVWGEPFSEDTNFIADSRIDILETTTQNLGTQLTTLATEQSTLEQNLEETKVKIPIEMYIAINSSASDTIVLNAAPQDKSIFFIVVPQGTLGKNNLVLQTNDIQFNNVIVKKTYNGEGIKIKYAPNSLISIYRNGSNAYVYNVPMVL